MTTIFKSNKIKASQKIGNINRLRLFLLQFCIEIWDSNSRPIFSEYVASYADGKEWYSGNGLELIITGHCVEINKYEEVGNSFEYKNKSFGELFEFLVSNGMDSKNPKKALYKLCKLNGFNFRKDVRPKAKPEKIKRKKVDRKIWPVIERAAKLEVNNLESYLKTREEFVMSKLDKPMIRKILRGVIQVIHRDEGTTDVLFENYSFRQKPFQDTLINEVSFYFLSQKMVDTFGKKYEYWREASIAII